MEVFIIIIINYNLINLINCTYFFNREILMNFFYYVAFTSSNLNYFHLTFYINYLMIHNFIILKIFENFNYFINIIIMNFFRIK